MNFFIFKNQKIHLVSFRENRQKNEETDNSSKPSKTTATIRKKEVY